jgi:hypothetical protein
MILIHWALGLNALELGQHRDASTHGTPSLIIHTEIVFLEVGT